MIHEGELSQEYVFRDPAWSYLEKLAAVKNDVGKQYLELYEQSVEEGSVAEIIDMEVDILKKMNSTADWAQRILPAHILILHSVVRSFMSDNRGIKFTPVQIAAAMFTLFKFIATDIKTPEAHRLVAMAMTRSFVAVPDYSLTCFKSLLRKQ